MGYTRTRQQPEAWIEEHDGYGDRFQILTRLREELGEVASVLQRVDLKTLKKSESRRSIGTQIRR